MWFTWQIKRIEVADPIKMEELRYGVLFFLKKKLYLLSNEKFLHVYIIIFLFVLLLLSFNMFCRSLVQAIRCLESAKEKRLSEEQPPPAVQQQEERLEGPNPSPPAPTLASTASSSSSSSSSTSMKNVAVAGTF
jgi:hypothetical protein